MIPESRVRREQDSSLPVKWKWRSYVIMQDLELGSCNASSKTTRYLADYGTAGDSTSKAQNVFTK